MFGGVQAVARVKPRREGVSYHARDRAGTRYLDVLPVRHWRPAFIYATFSVLVPIFCGSAGGIHDFEWLLLGGVARA
jgi:hypothetical protein